MNAPDHIPPITLLALSANAIIVSVCQWGEAIFRIGLMAVSFALAVEHLLRVRQDRLSRQKPTRHLSHLPVVLLTLFLFIFSGCTAMRSVTYDPVSGKRTTAMNAVTVFDASGSLSKFRNSSTQGTNASWTPGTYIGALSQEAHASTNLFEGLGIVLGTALKAAH